MTGEDAKGRSSSIDYGAETVEKQSTYRNVIFTCKGVS